MKISELAGGLRAARARVVVPEPTDLGPAGFDDAARAYGAGGVKIYSREGLTVERRQAFCNAFVTAALRGAIDALPAGLRSEVMNTALGG